MAENQEPVKVEEQGPFIHQLQLFLVGGQQFTVNEPQTPGDAPSPGTPAGARANLRG